MKHVIISYTNETCILAVKNYSGFSHLSVPHKITCPKVKYILILIIGVRSSKRFLGVWGIIDFVGTTGFCTNVCFNFVHFSLLMLLRRHNITRKVINICLFVNLNISTSVILNCTSNMFVKSSSVKII